MVLFIVSSNEHNAFINSYLSNLASVEKAILPINFVIPIAKKVELTITVPLYNTPFSNKLISDFFHISPTIFFNAVSPTVITPSATAVFNILI